jgi:Arc/MetJ-type ribon-helix-helix transcriptional regulator
VPDEFIHIRVPSTVKEDIQKLVDRNLYRDITDFVLKAIRVQLYPNEYREQIKESMINLIETDREFRDSFRKALLL